MMLTTRWKSFYLLFIFVVNEPRPVNLAPPHSKSCESCSNNAWSHEPEYGNSEIETTTSKPKKAYPPVPVTIPTTTTTPAPPTIFGCSTDMQQTFAKCLGRCTNSSCCVQELFNFFSACSSGIKQNCTTTTTKNINCDQCGIANYHRKARRIGGNTIRHTIDQTRIVGGKEVKPKRKYPWQVGLVNPYYFNSVIDCGGSIINNRWILTAAHCVIDVFEDCQELTNWTDGLQVRVGEHEQYNTEDDDPENTKDYTVKRYVIHPLACPAKKYHTDIALLELAEEIPFNNVIKPVCLPKDDSKTYAGVKATISGWGLTTDDGKRSHVLKEVGTVIDDQSDCKGWGKLKDTQLCAGPLPGKDSCQGDSGGPLIVKEDNKYIQVGIVSYGAKCGDPESSAVYARVSKVLDWIKETTTSGKCC